MGHYDDCREAEERRIEEATSLKFKGTIHKMDDATAGRLRNSIDEIFVLAAKMNGTADQHRSLESYRKQLKEMLK